MLRPATVLGLLGLALLGCTSHAADEESPKADEPPRTEAPPEPPSTVSPSWEPPIAITQLRHKPFVGAIGELTGDGQVDVLALCHAPDGAALVLLRGSRDGTFVETDLLLTEASGLALGDLDGDGDLDALLLDARGKPAYRVARNDGSGNFSIGSKQRIPGTYGGELRGASLADLDGDGDLDAIVPLWDDIRILIGDGTGEFEPGAALDSGRDPFATVLADLDGDGRLDLAATSGAAPANDPDVYESAGASAWIYRGREHGFAKPARVEVSGAKQIAYADLDGDGRIELVVSGDGGLTVIRDPLGDPQANRTLVATDGTLLIADLLEAPGLELITTSYMQARVHLLGNYPKLDKTSIEAGSYVVGLFAQDVDHDQHSDLVLLDAGPPTGPLAPPESAVEVVFFP